MKKTYILLASFLFAAQLFPQEPFTLMMAISLTGLGHSSVAWGDYDNDGDLDILLTGAGYGRGVTISKIYRNDGDTTFTEQTSISLTGVGAGSVAWGDYDNDGDLDILLTGLSYVPDTVSVSKIYRNNGDNTFTDQTSISLTGVQYSSVAWGDYDNDGDLDILLTGFTIPDSVSVSKIYRNNGDNTFTEQTSISLFGAYSSSAAWGDYDNDGDLDILLTGYMGGIPGGGGGGSSASKIYRNDGGTFTEQTSISLTGVYNGSAAWGDYDNDGDLDILLTGGKTIGFVSKIYRNNGDNTFTDQTSISLTGVFYSSAAWGDYDNDGYLDILITGSSGYMYPFAIIYHNDGDNTFTQQPAYLQGVYFGSVAWGDYDNDGDLDILLTGWTEGSLVSIIYRNNSLTPNTLPAAPSNLQSIVSGQDVTLSWDKSTDNETPQNGLRYNLVIGTSPNSVNILSPMSDRNTGYRRVINLGNTNHNNSWTIKGLDLGQTYYWSVQALDNCFAASSFAQEKTFSTETTTFQLTVEIQDNWNLVSIPGLHPTNQDVDTWWQYKEAGSLVYYYAEPTLPPPSGYTSVDSVTPGLGYWMKHDDARTYNTGPNPPGDEWPAGGIQIVPHDPISVFTGWNIFGGYENTVAVSGITTVPPGKIKPNSIYQYSSTTPPTGYTNPVNLEPGRGYWVQIDTSVIGVVINIPNSLEKGSGEVVNYYKEDWGRIIITDAAGSSYTLYAVKGEVNLDLYELPPVPPAGMFDIRFSSGRIAEDINSAIQTIEMSGITYPLTVRVEGMDIRLMDETGKNINVSLKSGEDVVIDNSTINKLMVSGELIPTVYALEQNYPNPFNPSTVIEFSLPENVGNVQLSIYNTLGEKVAELVNTTLVAGKYSYQWNAKNVATGMYIYELRTDKFVSVKKMILLK